MIRCRFILGGLSIVMLALMVFNIWFLADSYKSDSSYNGWIHISPKGAIGGRQFIEDVKIDFKDLGPLTIRNDLNCLCRYNGRYDNKGLTIKTRISEVSLLKKFVDSRELYIYYNIDYERKATFILLFILNIFSLIFSFVVFLIMLEGFLESFI